MTTGDVHEVSRAIGTLEGRLGGIEEAVKQGNASRRDLHEKVNTIGQQVTELGAKLSSVVGAVENLAGTVQTHETERNQNIGSRKSVVAIAAAASAVVTAAVEALKHIKF